MKRLATLLANRDGAAAVEYALLAVLISIASMQAIGMTGNALSNTFIAVAADLSNANSMAL